MLLIKIASVSLIIIFLIKRMCKKIIKPFLKAKKLIKNCFLKVLLKLLSKYRNDYNFYLTSDLTHLYEVGIVAFELDSEGDVLIIVVGAI